MTTFRKKFVIALISFIVAVFTVGQLNWANPLETLGFFLNVVTTETLLPLTIGLVLILGLLLWWNPDNGR